MNLWIYSLMKRQADEIASLLCQNDHLPKWRFAKISILPNDPKRQNDNLTKWQFDKMTIWQNDNLTKWQFTKMTIYQNDNLPNGHFIKWLLPDHLVYWLVLEGATWPFDQLADDRPVDKMMRRWNDAAPSKRIGHKMWMTTLPSFLWTGLDFNKISGLK